MNRAKVETKHCLLNDRDLNWIPTHDLDDCTRPSNDSPLYLSYYSTAEHHTTMPIAEATTNSGQPGKTSGRQSGRYSLNFSSVGKAFADAIHKESSSKDPERHGKKVSKDSRRLSAQQQSGTAPRLSVDANSRPPSASRRSSLTPETKTITTRKRVSGITHRPATEDGLLAHSNGTPVAASAMPMTRTTSTLRPRSGTSSNLPKYRPKSIIATENAQEASDPSPARTNRRRRLNTSSDSEEDAKDAKIPEADKSKRANSPLPHRAALKANLTRAVNGHPSAPSPPPKTKSSSPAVAPKGSPTRPSKLMRHTAGSGSSTSIPRPSSAASTSSASRTPGTPNLNPSKPSSGLATRHDSPSSSWSSSAPMPESPITRHVRTSSARRLAAAENQTANMSHISEGNSEDYDAADVEMLLAPVAAIGAPTPAMPKLESRRRMASPLTPSRPKIVPMKPDISPNLLQTPARPSPVSSLRPNPSPNSAPRGSILSFEQLATQSISIGTVDVSMLSEEDLPYRPGAISPLPSLGLDPPSLPSSPLLSAMNTPAGFGSLSRVLLPDVTPSPAARHSPLRYDDGNVDSAALTLLKLQLASTENMAKDRLSRLQQLEEENHALKQARRQDAHDLTQQVGLLESQMRGSLEASQRSASEKETYIASLERQLAGANVQKAKDIQNAVAAAQEEGRRCTTDAVNGARMRWEVSLVANKAGIAWQTVCSKAQDEMELIAADRAVLAMLLDQVAFFQC